VTMEMVDQAEKFIIAHGLPFNREGWEYIVNECNGMLPLQIRAVPEGMQVPEDNVMVTVENTDPNCAWVTSYIETALLRAVWYGTTVATRSFRFRELIEGYLEDTGDPSLIDFKFVDFGARGASSKESSEKASKAGRVILVKRYGVRQPITIREEEKLPTDVELLETVFLNGELVRDMTFEEVRANSRKKW